MHLKYFIVKNTPTRCFFSKAYRWLIRKLVITFASIPNSNTRVCKYVFIHEHSLAAQTLIDSNSFSFLFTFFMDGVMARWWIIFVLLVISLIFLTFHANSLLFSRAGLGFFIFYFYLNGLAAGCKLYFRWFSNASTYSLVVVNCYNLPVIFFQILRRMVNIDLKCNIPMIIPSRKTLPTTSIRLERLNPSFLFSFTR